jgi:hypothetical protein
MEFVILGVSTVVGMIGLKIVDRIQKRRWSQSIEQSEKQSEREPLWIETGLRKAS